MVFSLVYVSSASATFTEDELVDILRTSRERNAAAGITGALLYSNGNLMQVLEGDETAVRRLYAKISRDRRHTGLITLIGDHQETRQFADWAMACQDPDMSGSADGEGFDDFLTTPFTKAEFGADPTACQRLLLGFKQRLSRTS